MDSYRRPTPPQPPEYSFIPTVPHNSVIKPGSRERENGGTKEFKTTINLSAYAASQGYELDRKESSRNSVIMRNGGGDKIVIARGLDGHWIYFSVRDDTDNGSIIDFVQNRKGCKLGRVRQELRPWIGSGNPSGMPQITHYVREVQKTSKDRQHVLSEYARMQPITRHRYLEEERCIPAAILQNPRFAGKMKVDIRNNAIFPHYDRDGLCGYEIKNRNFTGFAKGGDKGLWFSAARKGDTCLVIAESTIDAISYAVLHPEEGARYASIGGKMNPNQSDLIHAAIERMPEGAKKGSRHICP